MIYKYTKFNYAIWQLDSDGPSQKNEIPGVTPQSLDGGGGGKDKMEAWVECLA